MDLKLKVYKYMIFSQHNRQLMYFLRISYFLLLKGFNDDKKIVIIYSPHVIKKLYMTLSIVKHKISN